MSLNFVRDVEFLIDFVNELQKVFDENSFSLYFQPADTILYDETELISTQPEKKPKTILSDIATNVSKRKIYFHITLNALNCHKNAELIFRNL